jgi:beta-N-acetylhexosaminidase
LAYQHLFAGGDEILLAGAVRAPYYLCDAPRLPCLVNAYTAAPPVQHAVLRKLLGEEAFVGVSPVDACCGQGDAEF